LATLRAGRLRSHSSLDLHLERRFRIYRAQRFEHGQWLDNPGWQLQVTASTGTLTVGGAIGDGGHAYLLTKAGMGTLTLAGANNYTGSTLINAGKLALSSGGSISNSPSSALRAAPLLTFRAERRRNAAFRANPAGWRQHQQRDPGHDYGQGPCSGQHSPLQFTAFKPAGSGGAVPWRYRGRAP